MDKMRRDLHAGSESNRSHAKPKQLSPEKQNHRADQHAQNWNRQVHSSVMSTELETSLNVSESIVRTEIVRDSSTSLGMTRWRKSRLSLLERERIEVRVYGLHPDHAVLRYQSDKSRCKSRSSSLMSK